MTSPAGGFSPSTDYSGQGATTSYNSNDIFGLGSLGGISVYTYSSPGLKNSHLPAEDQQGANLYMTGNDWMTQFSASAYNNGKQYQAYQQALYVGGFYGSEKPKYGVFTSRDADAMKKALAGYQQAATGYAQAGKGFLTMNDYLTSVVKAPGGGGSTAAAPPPLSLTDPAELQQTLQAAAQNALGRKLSKDELGHFVNAFHGKEKSAYNSQVAGKTYTNPEVSGEAMNYVDDNHGAEEDEARQASYLDSMNKMLGVL